MAAIQQLQVSRPEKFAEHFGAGVPVRIMPFDATQTPDQALAVELAENEKRVNYTRDQIERLAARLRLSTIERHQDDRPRERRHKPQQLQSLEKSLAALIALPADNNPTAHQEINELSAELRVKIQAVLAEDQDKVGPLPASSADCS